MAEINVDCGYRIEENGTTQYFGGETNNGICYKDLSAWDNDGIIYISEYELEDLGNGISQNDLWTKQSWLEWVEHHLKGNDLYYQNGCAEHIAQIVLHECDWQCLSTMLEEIDIEETIKWYLFDECVKYCNEHFDRDKYNMDYVFSQMAMQRSDLKSVDYMVYTHLLNLINDFITDYEIEQKWFDDNIGTIDDIALDILQKC